MPKNKRWFKDQKISHLVKEIAQLHTFVLNLERNIEVDLISCEGKDAVYVDKTSKVILEARKEITKATKKAQILDEKIRLLQLE
jgi:hypothetical protein